MRYAMIMAGGAGTRLWPMSRRARPKQLLPFIHGRSLLQIAADRLEGLVPADRRYICTSEAHRDLIRSTLPSFTDDQILGEPSAQDTVNAAGLTAAVLHKNDPDAVFAVLTADHLIEPEDAFRRRLDVGYALVEAEPSRLVTFAITPTFPATGYGYVERGEPIANVEGAYRAKHFVEKPNEADAKRFLQAGTHAWNSGTVVFHAGTFLSAMQRYVPQSYNGLMRIAAAWGTPQQRAVLEEAYPTLTKISLDHGVMEPASRDADYTVCTVDLPVQWLDVGSWPAYGETLDADAQNNRSNTRTLHIDSTNVLAVSDTPEHLIATIGCQDMMIVHTKDVTMVCPAAQAQRVKDLAGAADEPLR